ncbi:MAG: hypothetical protein KAR40_08055 [Candidatus Sabulitectum sp.]|nr:hypothetical protein [Candidatus Sabulitectum sp.]
MVAAAAGAAAAGAAAAGAAAAGAAAAGAAAAGAAAAGAVAAGAVATGSSVPTLPSLLVRAVIAAVKFLISVSNISGTSSFIVSTVSLGLSASPV